MKRFILTGILSLATLYLQGQSLQPPSEFLGYQLGARFTLHHRIVDYFEHVAAANPNVIIQPYGETNEHRPLVVAIISAQKNMEKLETIRTDNLKRAGLLPGTPESANIAIVWLSYNVHGNEASSSEATMQTLYELANSANTATQKWLENTVVILDPCINPDGRDRYANFYNQFGNTTPNPNPDSKEHHENWPGGRFNHYIFDLNRDWAWQTQVESAQRIKLYNQWMPHIHVDFHEQGINSPYYFAPAAEPYHQAITDWQRELQSLIGKNNARYFNNEGWLYFTKERFDLLYPSYGDTYPTYNGAIGMTYEQAGHGRGGLAVQIENGDTLRLADRIAHHTTTSLSTIEVAAGNSERLVTEFADFFKGSMKNPQVKFKSFIISKTNNPDKLAALQNLLDKQGISYGIATASAKKITGFSYQTNSSISFSVESGDMLVSAYQPRGALASVLFEPKTALADSMTYDITAWSLPYVYGLEAYATETKLIPKALAGPAQATPATQLKKPYALVARYESFADVKFLAALLDQGIKVRSAMGSFTIEGKQYARGSMIIARADNKHKANYIALARNIAKIHNRELFEAKTGLVDTGKDFGSGNVSLMTTPKVAALSGDGVSPTGFGQIWFYFEQELKYPLTVLDAGYFSQVDLSDYDVLILPNGSYGNLTEKTLNKLKIWVNGGGKLILIEGALKAVVDKEGFGLKSRLDEDESSDKDEEDPTQKRFANRQRERLTGFIPGAIYNVALDNSHPLAFGYTGHFFSLKKNAAKYVLLKNGWNVGVLGSPKPVSGFAGHKTVKKLNNTLVFGVEPMGEGQIIYFVDDPIFRSFWYNGKQMLGNAVFVVGI
jgi:hypothetical protein